MASKCVPIQAQCTWLERREPYGADELHFCKTRLGANHATQACRGEAKQCTGKYARRTENKKGDANTTTQRRKGVPPLFHRLEAHRTAKAPSRSTRKDVQRWTSTTRVSATLS